MIDHVTSAGNSAQPGFGTDAGLLATLQPEAVAPATKEWINRRKGLSLAMRMVLRIALRLEWGTLIVILPDGEALRFSGQEAVDRIAIIHIHDMAVAAKLIREGIVGFSAAYIDGHWDSPDLAALIELASHNGQRFQQFIEAQPFVRLAQRFAHLLNRNTRRQAKKNIEAHYDLGNAFYETWLDRTMTYSSALFDHPAQELSLAQEAKFTALLQRLDVQPGHRLLEIGCGWGGFAIHAARTTGAHVTGLTISKEQYDMARRRVAEAGLEDRVSIQYEDYRDVKGRFDRIASIEMFEAVGEKYWPVFFSQIRKLLEPQGRAGLQIITIRNDLFEHYRRNVDFIQAYIFPGGMLPSPAALSRSVRQAGLTLDDESTFGQDYARTLHQWRRRFEAQWKTIETQGFDERFKRLWTYYLSYCEGGFRAGATDVGQYILARD